MSGPVVVGGVLGGALVVFVVWHVVMVRLDERRDAREREAMESDPPILGVAYRPRHYRGRPPT